MDPLTGELNIEVYNDYLQGFNYLQAVFNGSITSNNTVLLFSFNGAQLYKNKQSNCWIVIWLLLDCHPETCYMKTKVFPAFFIPGSKNPENSESYYYPTLHHISALQKEGFCIWDADLKCNFTSCPITLLFTADTVALMDLNGFVGHRGACGCQAYCNMTGCQKPNDHKYYPVLFIPDNYDVHGCSHPDIDVSHFLWPSVTTYTQDLAILLGATSITNYREHHHNTEITRPSIISGLVPGCMLGIPGSFPLDLMHLAALVLSDLLLSLWHGTIACDANDDKTTWDWATLIGDAWEMHGKQVATARQFLPGSFDCPPQNITEKLNSGYKAWEFLTYLYGLGPRLLYPLLHLPYWQNYCQLVSTIQSLHQKSLAINSL